MLTPVLLNTYVGKNITDICLNDRTNNKSNHCAHFVSHVLGLSFGMTCARLIGAKNTRVLGANVRVQEIFAQCSNSYEFIECPVRIEGLIFVSKTTNFVSSSGANAVRNVPKKHIGIILNGVIWHYSNSRNRVITQSMLEFISHYKRQTNALWFGEIPRTARPMAWTNQCTEELPGYRPV